MNMLGEILAGMGTSKVFDTPQHAERYIAATLEIPARDVFIGSWGVRAKMPDGITENAPMPRWLKIRRGRGAQ